VTRSAEDPLVSQAFDASKHEDLARAIENLTSEEAQFFLHKLENAIRKRKIQLTGYLIALAVWLLTMIAAMFYCFFIVDGFVLWVFLIPFASVGAILYGFGRWSERAGNAPPRAIVVPPAAKPAEPPPAAE
jgi:hypothetical protein